MSPGSCFTGDLHALLCAKARARHSHFWVHNRGLDYRSEPPSPQKAFFTPLPDCWFDTSGTRHTCPSSAASEAREEAGPRLPFLLKIQPFCLHLKDPPPSPPETHAKVEPDRRVWTLLQQGRPRARGRPDSCFLIHISARETRKSAHAARSHSRSFALNGITEAVICGPD